MNSMASQISQLADAVDRLDTQYGKLPSQPVSNVRNASAISSMSCMESPPMHVPEPMVEVVVLWLLKILKKKMVSSPKKRGVSFDPPLNLNSYMFVAPFPSRLAVAKGSADKEEVSSI